VVVVRGRPDARGPVVVWIHGIDPRDAAALDYGFGYAARHGLRLRALHAYPALAPAHPVPASSRRYPLREPAAAESEAHRLIQDALSPWTAKYPEVEVDITAVHEPPAVRLVEASAQAAVIVVGSRGLGEVEALLRGSVGHAVLRHAHCPVTIAR
jgi:nucleotide-binding universal stress UspA family protein